MSWKLVTQADDLSAVVSRRIVIEKIRGAVSHPVSRAQMEYDHETYDFGRSAAHCLTLWLARLPEQGTLEVSWPATWWDHFKRDMRWKPLLGWLVRQLSPAKLTTMRYEASLYLPSVDLPDRLRDGEFYLWSHGREVK